MKRKTATATTTTIIKTEFRKSLFSLMKVCLSAERESKKTKAVTNCLYYLSLYSQWANRRSHGKKKDCDTLVVIDLERRKKKEEKMEDLFLFFLLSRSFALYFFLSFFLFFYLSL